MADPRALRASDDDRDRAVTALRSHCLDGRLTLEEFAERVDGAYTARTAEELDVLMAGLPEPGRSTRLRPKRLTFAAFGRFVRRGRWRVPRQTTVVSVFADVDFDLREAELEAESVAVRVFALFGNVDVYVPEGVEVDAGGLVIFGHRREWGRDLPARPLLPLVRVRSLSLFGTLDIWRVPPGVTGGYRKVIKAVKGQQRELRR